MRFYFDLSDCLPIRDEIGRDYNLSSEAVLHAKYLAADLRCHEHDIRARLSIQVFGEGREQIHEEGGLAKPCRTDHFCHRLDGIHP